MPNFIRLISLSFLCFAALSCASLGVRNNAIAELSATTAITYAVEKYPETRPIFAAVAQKFRGGSPDFAVFDDAKRRIVAQALGNAVDILAEGKLDKARAATVIENALGIGQVTVPPDQPTPDEPNLDPLTPAPTPLEPLEPSA